MLVGRSAAVFEDCLKITFHHEAQLLIKSLCCRCDCFKANLSVCFSAGRYSDLYDGGSYPVAETY